MFNRYELIFAGAGAVETLLYEEAGAVGGFVLKIYPCGHLETRAMREDILSFIKETL